MAKRTSRNPRQNRRQLRRRAVCYFTTNNIHDIDYKDVDLLQRFITENGKIIPCKISGTRNFFQRRLAKAIKRARYIGLLPYTDLHRKNDLQNL